MTMTPKDQKAFQDYIQVLREDPPWFNPVWRRINLRIHNGIPSREACRIMFEELEAARPED